MVFIKFFKKKDEDEEKQDFIEIDTNKKFEESKVFVKTFNLKAYEDVNNILNALREGYTIVIIDTKNLKNRDVIELKRAISKIKKTVEAMEGSIVGFGETTVIAAPQFVKIKKGSIEDSEKKTTKEELD
ncbi:MAG: cell division protein SepF [Candidatus Pacearchaeota archaeon]